MDTSSKLEIDKVEFILGGYAVPRYQLDAFAWLEIARAALETCKPYLKYFPNFKPIGEFLNSTKEYDSRTTDVSMVKFPGEIGPKTRCVNVGSNLKFDTEGSLSDGSGVQYVDEKNLLLTQEGQWLFWDLRYERVPQYGLGYRAHRSGIKEVPSRCEFSLISEQELLVLLRQYPGLGWDILGQLCYLTEVAVKERRSRLSQFERINDSLAGMRNRIDR